MCENIGQLAREALGAFDAIRDLRHVSAPEEDELSNAKKDIENTYVNFRLWTGNLGALQPVQDARSLEFRLRREPAVAQRIREILTELTDSLQKFMTWGVGESDPLDIPTGDGADETDCFLEDFLDLKTSASCQLSWLTASVADAVRRLHKISLLIEKSITRDRYAHAEAHLKVKYPECHDLAHTRAKYASRKPASWLVDRLGKAITKRRNYLKYAREHQHRLNAPSDPTPRTAKSTEWMLISGRQQQQQPYQNGIAPSVRPSELSRPSLQLTAASTLARIDVNIMDDGFDDDDRSCYTKATSISDGKSADRQKVARLEEFATKGEPFECPYCCTMQKFNGQLTWQRHVYSDLRAYICTSKDCGMLMFNRKRDWVAHELENHRREWQCQVCGKAQFKTKNELQDHVHQSHASAITSQAVSQLLSRPSSTPSSYIDVRECPLCDWEETMRKLNPQIAITDAVIVPPQRFMKHLAGHLEELALFAIPRGGPEDGTSDDGKSVNVSRRELEIQPPDVQDYVNGLEELDGTEELPINADDGYQHEDDQLLVTTDEDGLRISGQPTALNAGRTNEANLSPQQLENIKGYTLTCQNHSSVPPFEMPSSQQNHKRTFHGSQQQFEDASSVSAAGSTLSQSTSQSNIFPFSEDEQNAATDPWRNSLTQTQNNELNPEGAGILPREIDKTGETKVSSLGRLLGGRSYKCQTFEMPDRGGKLYMLATECARVLGYRDPWLLLRKNPTLARTALDRKEKGDLVSRNLLPSSDVTRVVYIITARSVFRQFGGRIVKDGRRVHDDYWETRAIQQGFAEENYAYARTSASPSYDMITGDSKNVVEATDKTAALASQTPAPLNQSRNETRSFDRVSHYFSKTDSQLERQDLSDAVQFPQKSGNPSSRTPTQDNTEHISPSDLSIPGAREQKSRDSFQWHKSDLMPENVLVFSKAQNQPGPLAIPDLELPRPPRAPMNLPERRHECPQPGCRRRFNRANDLARHLRNVHNEAGKGDKKDENNERPSITPTMLRFLEILRHARDHAASHKSMTSQSQKSSNGHAKMAASSATAPRTIRYWNCSHPGCGQRYILAKHLIRHQREVHDEDVGKSPNMPTGGTSAEEVYEWRGERGVHGS